MTHPKWCIVQQYKLTQSSEEYITIINDTLKNVKKEYKEKAFLSTSLVKDLNVMKDKGVVVNIKVPSGKNCYITTNKKESECIFGIGTTIELASVIYDTSEKPHKFVANYKMR